MLRNVKKKFHRKQIGSSKCEVFWQEERKPVAFMLLFHYQDTFKRPRRQIVPKVEKLNDCFLKYCSPDGTFELVYQDCSEQDLDYKKFSF